MNFEKLFLFFLSVLFGVISISLLVSIWGFYQEIKMEIEDHKIINKNQQVKEIEEIMAFYKKEI